MLRHDPLAARLHRALVREELSLHFQPLVEATSHQVIGAEALLRWHAPEIGDVPPQAVIPLAEESGLIHALTLAVLNQALAQCRDWHRKGATLHIAVNVSPLCLKDETFPRRVAALLKAWSVPAPWLTLELTARAELDDLPRAAAVLQSLRAMGLRIVLDGFGNGNASFQRLKQLPCDGIKLDRTYVQGVTTNPVDHAIVMAVQAIARNLGCQAIATGIESEAAMHTLRDAGYDMLQGFWLGEPVPAEMFSQRWLARPGAVLMFAPQTPQR